MTEFNPLAGGVAVMLALALFMGGVVFYLTWDMITQYHHGWIEALQVWGATAGIALLVFAIFVVGGTFG